MRKLALVLALAVFGFSAASAQILTPVKWQFGAKKLNDKEAVIIMKAVIEDGWHIYSQNVEDGGPVKTSFTFDASKDFTLNGKTIEPKPKTKFEEVFGMDVPYFSKEVVFQQKVKLNKGQTTVKGYVEFMACDAERCLPPDEVPFAIAIK